jgi:hypothetical protein
LWTRAKTQTSHPQEPEEAIEAILVAASYGEPKVIILGDAEEVAIRYSAYTRTLLLSTFFVGPFLGAVKP